MYVTAKGKAPFEGWIHGLRDRAGRARVRVQVDRLSLGNFGKCRFLNEGLGERWRQIISAAGYPKGPGVLGRLPEAPSWPHIVTIAILFCSL